MAVGHAIFALLAAARAARTTTIAMKNSRADELERPDSRRDGGGEARRGRGRRVTTRTIDCRARHGGGGGDSVARRASRDSVGSAGSGGAYDDLEEGGKTAVSVPDY